MPISKHTDEDFSILKSLRQKCKMCSARRFFQDGDEYKKTTQNFLKKLYDFYLQEFNELRSLNSTPYETITALKENKQLCLDLKDTCIKCDKEIDKVNIESKKFKEYKV